MQNIIINDLIVMPIEFIEKPIMEFEELLVRTKTGTAKVAGRMEWRPISFWASENLIDIMTDLLPFTLKYQIDGLYYQLDRCFVLAEEDKIFYSHAKISFKSFE